MPNVFRYSIHDIITLESNVLLPELDYFQHQELSAPPTIRVRVGPVTGKTGRTAGSPSAGERLVFRELLGPLGFEAALQFGPTIDLVASPLLRWSPHVLYTNLVEPLLRWTFAARGFALVHAACLVFGGGAYLITARTDTGKTSTVLSCLAAQRSALGVACCAGFLSDDLTLLRPDGRVLAYPKPLTISHHTTKVVPAAVLSRGERLALAVQGRVHSRLSRRIALRLADTRLPMATANAILQAVVPPPKYHLQRLLPGVNIPGETHLSGLLVISRGGSAQKPLDGDTALSTLMRNSDDAYGFPPYHVIEPFLSQRDGCDLRAVERATVSRGLRGLPATLLESENMGWWRLILNLTGGGFPARDLLPEPVAPVAAA